MIKWTQKWIMEKAGQVYRMYLCIVSSFSVTSYYPGNWFFFSCPLYAFQDQSEGTGGGWKRRNSYLENYFYQHWGFPRKYLRQIVLNWNTSHLVNCLILWHPYKHVPHRPSDNMLEKFKTWISNLISLKCRVIANTAYLHQFGLDCFLASKIETSDRFSSQRLILQTIYVLNKKILQKHP